MCRKQGIEKARKKKDATQAYFIDIVVEVEEKDLARPCREDPARVAMNWVGIPESKQAKGDQLVGKSSRTDGRESRGWNYRCEMCVESTAALQGVVGGQGQSRDGLFGPAGLLRERRAVRWILQILARGPREQGAKQARVAAVGK